MRLPGALLVGLLLPAIGVRAETRPGAAFLAIPMSVRQTGMGDTTMGGNDILRSWSNPAMLARLAGTGEAAVTGSSLFGGEQVSSGLGLGWRISPALTLGGLMSYHSVSTAEIDVFGNTVSPDLGQNLFAVGIAAAARFGPLSLGATVKGITEKLLERSGSTGAVDLGCVLEWGKFSAGVAGRNLGPAIRRPRQDVIGEALPAELRMGAAFPAATDSLTAALDYAWRSGRSGTAGFGFECRPISALALRLGVSGIGPGFEPRINLGFSGTDSRLGLDYAYTTHPAGSSHQVSLSCAFGGSPTR